MDTVKNPRTQSPFAQDYLLRLFPLVGFKGNRSLLGILFFSPKVCYAYFPLLVLKGIDLFWEYVFLSFGVSAQIGSGVLRGGPEVRFHQGSAKVPRGSAMRGGASTKKSTECCWNYTA